jgi:hypothetical protein
MPSTLPAELQRSDVQSAILRALARAYEENQNRHDPGLGDDPLTFGMHLWKSGTYFLAAELSGLPGIAIEVVNQSLDVHTGRCRLRMHKLGDSEFDKPETSFPNHVGPATRMGRTEQLELGLNLPPKNEHLDWVIGHYGTADDGLRAVRLQAVGNERALDGRISRWEAIETLFDASTGAVVAIVTPRAQDDVVVAPEPAVTLRAVTTDVEDEANPA